MNSNVAGVRAAAALSAGALFDAILCCDSRAESGKGTL
jgi:hypothetical protein